MRSVSELQMGGRLEVLWVGPFDSGLWDIMSEDKTKNDKTHSLFPNTPLRIARILQCPSSSTQTELLLEIPVPQLEAPCAMGRTAVVYVLQLEVGQARVLKFDLKQAICSVCGASPVVRVGRW